MRARGFSNDYIKSQIYQCAAVARFRYDRGGLIAGLGEEIRALGHSGVCRNSE